MCFTMTHLKVKNDSTVSPLTQMSEVERVPYSWKESPGSQTLPYFTMVKERS